MDEFFFFWQIKKWSFQELYVGMWMCELILTQFSLLLNELNTALQGWAKQLICFITSKSFEIELEKRDVGYDTFNI